VWESGGLKPLVRNREWYMVVGDQICTLVAPLYFHRIVNQTYKPRRYFRIRF
jgi:hypothetical protein